MKQKHVSACHLAWALLFAWAWGAAAEPTTNGFVRVSPRDPRYLELSDGRPYIPIGLNLIAPDGARGGGEANGLRRMGGWLAQLATNGGNYARVWLSSPFWAVEWQRSGEYDETRARRLDALLALARERGVRLKLTLEHFRTIDGVARQPWAHQPLHQLARGGSATNIADFFAGTTSRDRFRLKLAWYAQRYPADPTIYGWELWNEINAVSGGDYLAWTEAMLPELHRLFPRQLAMQSLGSFDHDSVRGLYRRMSRLPGNDVAQVHRYLDLGAALAVCHGPVDVLAADAVRELLAFEPGRPVLLAESGAVEPRHAGPFKLYAQDTHGMLLHDILFAPFFAGAAGPGQCWHWDQYVDRNRLWYHFGRFASCVRDLDPPAEQFRPLLLDHPRLRVYCLQGRHTLLLWCRDQRNTWQTELAEGRAPETVSDARLDLAPLLAARSVRRIQTYDPWRDRWAEGRLDGQTFALPAFDRSLVVRMNLAE